MPLDAVREGGQSDDPQARRPAGALTHFRRGARMESGHSAEVTATVTAAGRPGLIRSLHLQTAGQACAGKALSCFMTAIVP